MYILYKFLRVEKIIKNKNRDDEYFSQFTASIGIPSFGLHV